MLGTFRAANMRHDITGMLLYHNSDFMQFLKGSEIDVLALLKNIESDLRRHRVTVAMHEGISERHFSHWSMAFRDLAVPSWTSSPGYSEFLNMPFHAIPFWRTPDKCQELMLIFRAMLL